MSPHRKTSARPRVEILVELLEPRRLFASISGAAFLDRNDNGVRDGLEELVSGVPVFADYDANGIVDSGEPFVFSGANGAFSLPDVLSGTYPLGVGEPGLWTGPASPTPMVIAPEQAVTGVSLPVRTPVRDVAFFGAAQDTPVSGSGSGGASSIAMLGDGRHVIAWTAGGGTSTNVVARRFAANGSPVGLEFPVNQYLTGIQSDPSVAMLSNGSFVVAWEGEGTGDSSGIYARLFAADGTPLTNQILVNSYTTGGQDDPSVVISPAGIVTIVWDGSGPLDDYGIYARRFNSGLLPLATEFLVNNITADFQNAPYIAAAGNTGYLIAWGSGFDLQARRYDSNGLALGSEFNIANPTASFLKQVVGDADGNYLITWTSLGGGLKVMARRYSASLDALAPAFLVSSTTAGGDAEPQLVMNDAGEFVILWTRLTSPSDAGNVYARHFNAAGIPQGQDFIVNVYTPGSQSAPVAAMDAQGNFVVAWHGPSQLGNPTVSSRRFTVAPPAPVAAADFIWQADTQRIAIAFDNPDPALIASMTPSNVQLKNLANGQILSPTAITTPPSESPGSAIFTFPTLPNAMLPNGRYLVTVYPGNTPEHYSHSFEIFFVNGDANHDGLADLRDLYTLSQNWLMPSNFEYERGDFNLDGIVNKLDLTILAQNWQFDLAALQPPPAPAPTTARRTPTRTPVRQETAAELVDSTASRPATRTAVRAN